MAKETKVREASILDDITIAPAKPADRYATAPVDRYASAPVDRYASAPVTDRYASLDRYAAAAAETVDAKPAVDRYNRKDRYAGKVRRAGRALHRTLVLLIPPLSGDRKGQLLCVQGGDYERCFEGWDIEEPWSLGAVIEFDYAAEAAEFTWGDGDPDEDHHLIATEYDTEEQAFQVDDWYNCELEAGDEVYQAALELRKALAKDPELVVEHLYASDLANLRDLAGMRRSPEPMEVLAAIVNDPIHGLGAAALDYAVWRQPEAHGAVGAKFAEVLTETEEVGYIRRIPMETFIVHASHVNAETKQVPSRWREGDTDWLMGGDYVIADVTYTSDLTGKVPCGWRSLWLEPKS